MIRRFAHHERQRYCFSFLPLPHPLPFITTFAVYGAVKRLAYPLRLGSKKMSTSGHRADILSLGANRRYHRRGFMTRDPVFVHFRYKKSRVTIVHACVCVCRPIDRYLACSIIREAKILHVFTRPRWGDSRLRLRVWYRWAILARKFEPWIFFRTLLNRKIHLVSWNYRERSKNNTTKQRELTDEKLILLVNKW